MTEFLSNVQEEDEDIENVREAGKLLNSLKDYNPLAKVEELLEGNYNMIDGVINNEKLKEEEKPDPEPIHEEPDQAVRDKEVSSGSILPPPLSLKDEPKASLKARLTEKMAIVAKISKGNDMEKIKSNEREV